MESLIAPYAKIAKLSESACSEPTPPHLTILLADALALQQVVQALAGRSVHLAPVSRHMKQEATSDQTYETRGLEACDRKSADIQNNIQNKRHRTCDRKSARSNDDVKRWQF